MILGSGELVGGKLMFRTTTCLLHMGQPEKHRLRITIDVDKLTRIMGQRAMYTVDGKSQNSIGVVVELEDD